MVRHGGNVRVWSLGKPEDVAGATLYLAPPAQKRF
jgi:hypothetical protein